MFFGAWGVVVWWNGCFISDWWAFTFHKSLAEWLSLSHSDKLAYNRYTWFCKYFGWNLEKKIPGNSKVNLWVLHAFCIMFCIVYGNSCLFPATKKCWRLILNTISQISIGGETLFKSGRVAIWMTSELNIISHGCDLYYCEGWGGGGKGPLIPAELPSFLKWLPSCAFKTYGPNFLLAAPKKLPWPIYVMITITFTYIVMLYRIQR